MFDIEKELKKLPAKPGVYIMHDKNDKIIYVGKAISLKNRVRQYFRKNNKTKLEVSIDEPLNVDWDGNELLLSDILGTDEDIISKDIENEVEKKLLYKAINKLNNREKTIVQMRYGLNNIDGEEMTQKEVADSLGISQSYISRLEKRIIKFGLDDFGQIRTYQKTKMEKSFQRKPYLCDENLKY